MESSTPLKDSVPNKEEASKVQTEDMVVKKGEGIQEAPAPAEEIEPEQHGDGSMVPKENGIGDSTFLSMGVTGNFETTQESIVEESPDLKPPKEAKKSETPDVLCLQLDEGDNLDGYLDKERARKMELLKSKEVGDVESKDKKEEGVKKATPKKGKPVRRVTKKKIVKPLPKKVKSKVVEKLSDVPEEKSEEPKKEAKKEPKKDLKKEAKKEAPGDSKEDEKPVDAIDQKTTPETSTKDQPEVSVKSVVVKCEKQDQAKAESRFLWVSNINRSTKANDLKILFTPHGKVQTARIVTDGRSYYGYLVMEKREEVEACLKQLEGYSFEGNKIHLSEKGPERKSRSKERTVAPKEASKDRSVKSSRHSSKSNDPLTLKVREKRDDDERKLELRKRSEERKELLRKQKEAERVREERRKERIKYEERKAQELKIEREKRKLEHERHLIEKEKMNLLRLQKRLADTERLLIQRQKQELERDIKNLEYKKRKTSTEAYDRKASERPETYDRKPAKVSRIEENRPKEYWKDHKPSPKPYEEAYKKETVMVPPPPVLTESYHQKPEKERSWETKKDDTSRYYDRTDYQERYPNKDRYKEKEKSYQWQGNYSGRESWRPEPPRSVPRHTQSFPGGSYGDAPPAPGYYQGTTFRKTNEYYYVGPDRKY